MKRIDLIEALKKSGCILIRRDGKHDWLQNPSTKMCQPIPGHREIGESLAKHIIKILK
ncbi:MAG: type II toxin-antitoxin system HicA family toxin [Candidatus Sabulitectum sp.]|nr:type II toxin-antitoxin system HicA family toxin [Candidatus Sabulitectum sp.]